MPVKPQDPETIDCIQATTDSLQETTDSLRLLDNTLARFVQQFESNIHLRRSTQQYPPATPVQQDPEPMPPPARIARPHRPQQHRLPVFTGSPKKWIQWKIKVKSILCQLEYMHILDDTESAQLYPETNQFLFHSLDQATQEGAACHVVNRSRDSRDGNQAWQNLLEWYEGDGMVEALANYVRHELRNLHLNDMSLTDDYIHKFIKYKEELIELCEEYTPGTLKTMFLDQIHVDEFALTVQLLQDDPMATFDDCVTKIQCRELNSIGSKTSVARQNKPAASQGHPKKKKTTHWRIPPFPDWIIRKVGTDVANDLEKWRAQYNGYPVDSANDKPTFRTLIQSRNGNGTMRDSAVPMPGLITIPRKRNFQTFTYSKNPAILEDSSGSGSDSD